MHERVGPCAFLIGPTVWDAKRLTHFSSNSLNITFQSCTADEFQWRFRFFNKKVAHPRLTALHHLNSVEKIWTRTSNRLTGEGSKIRDRETVLGRFIEVKKAFGCVSYVRKFFRLSKC